MADDPKDITLVLLPEMRDQNRAFRAEMKEFREDTNERLDTLEKQMMGVSSILMHIRGEQLDIEERVEALENLNAGYAE